MNRCMALRIHCRFSTITVMSESSNSATRSWPLTHHMHGQVVRVAQRRLDGMVHVAVVIPAARHAAVLDPLGNHLGGSRFYLRPASLR